MADTKDIMLINEKSLRDKIYIIRGQQVMLDYDLAEIYGYETKAFNRQVKNNAERFEGEDFMFRLTKDEFDYLRCKNYTSSWGGSRYLPNAFTEQGIYMLMTVLKGELATRQSLTLIRAFKAMRDCLADNAIVFQRLDRIELKQLEADDKFTRIFRQLEEPKPRKAAIFFQGQMWDATSWSGGDHPEGKPVDNADRQLRGQGHTGHPVPEEEECRDNTLHI